GDVDASGHTRLVGEAVGDPAHGAGQAPFVEIRRGERGDDAARLLQAVRGAGLEVPEEIAHPLRGPLRTCGPGEEEDRGEALRDAVVDVAREAGALALGALGALYPGQLVGQGRGLLLGGIERGDESLALDAVADEGHLRPRDPE